MARALNSREKTLLGVLAAAGIIVFWMTRPGEPGADAADPGKRPAKQVALPAPPVVRMELVEREVDPLADGGRDLFKYTQRPPSARELARLREQARLAKIEADRIAKLQAEQAERDRKLAEQRAIEIAANPPPPPKPMPPAIAFKYIGYLGPKDDRIAVFDDGGETLLAKRGETVREQFRVVDIRYESVVIGYVRKEFQSDTTELRLSGKAR